MKKLIYLFLTMVFICQYTIAQVPTYVPTDGLIGWWPFNGNANDESGNGLNGTSVGSPTPTQDRFGISNKAYSLDGINDYISVTRTYQSAFSLSIWFNPNASPLYNPLVDAFDANWEVQLKNTRPDYVSFITSTNYQEFISNQTTTNNNWYHLVCTYSSNTVKFYLNGNQTDQYSVYPLPNNNGNYYFGASLTGDDQFYNGKLDDIGIWNRPLTQEEITTLYESEVLSTNTANYESNINIYPNPANEYITIDFGNLDNVEGWNIKIINILGQEVLSQPMDNDKINVSELSKGVYIIRISDGVNQADKKFIKN